MVIYNLYHHKQHWVLKQRRLKAELLFTMLVEIWAVDMWTFVECWLFPVSSISTVSVQTMWPPWESMGGVNVTSHDRR